MPFPREEEHESDKIHGDKLEDAVDRASGERKRGQQGKEEADDDEIESDDDADLDEDEEDEEEDDDEEEIEEDEDDD